MHRYNPRILSLAVAALAALALTAPLPTLAQADYTFQIIHIPGADDASVLVGGPNASAVVTGWYTGADGFPHGFFWKDGVSTPYDLPGVDSTIPFALNAPGQVVGSFVTGSQGSEFYTTPSDQVIPVSIPGMLGTGAFGINISGQIVGLLDVFYCDPDTGDFQNMQFSFLATPTY